MSISSETSPGEVVAVRIVEPEGITHGARIRLDARFEVAVHHLFPALHRRARIALHAVHPRLVGNLVVRHLVNSETQVASRLRHVLRERTIDSRPPGEMRGVVPPLRLVQPLCVELVAHVEVELPVAGKRTFRREDTQGTHENRSGNPHLSSSHNQSLHFQPPSVSRYADNLASSPLLIRISCPFRT